MCNNRVTWALLSTLYKAVMIGKKEGVKRLRDVMTYVEPQLVVLIIVLYFVGMGLKKAKVIGDNHIPMLIGVCGVFIAALYVFGTEGFSIITTYKAICQGILCAGMSVYANQIYKQALKQGD